MAMDKEDIKIKEISEYLIYLSKEINKKKHKNNLLLKDIKRCLNDIIDHINQDKVMKRSIKLENIVNEY